MKRSTLLFTSCILGAGLLTACTKNPGTDTGNALDVALEALSSADLTSPVGVDAQGTAFTLTSAVAYVGDIEFDLPDDVACADLDPAIFEAPVFCEVEIGDEDDIKVQGPYIVDLLGKTSTPNYPG